MGFSGDSAADLQRDTRAVLAGDSQTDSCGDSEADFPAGSHRDSKTDSRRDLQRGFDGDFDGVLRARVERKRKCNPPQIRQDPRRLPTRDMYVCPLRVRSSDFLHPASEV